VKCNECGGQEILEGNPYAEHVKFTCQACEKKRRLNTNHLRPEGLKYEFSEDKGGKNE
jgi:transposase-like protein